MTYTTHVMTHETCHDSCQTERVSLLLLCIVRVRRHVWNCPAHFDTVLPALPLGRRLDLGHGRRQLLVERLRQPEGEQPGSGREDAEDDGRDAGVDLSVNGGKTRG